MWERLQKVWCDTLGIRVSDWENLQNEGELEIDSLMIINFIVNVEDEFGIELDDSMLLMEEGEILGKVYEELQKM